MNRRIVQILARELGIGKPITLPILAKAEDSLPDSFVWMPAGRHAITAGTLDGAGYAGEVVCDAAGYQAVQAAFEQITGAGQRVWIDLNHDDAAAAAWVKSFSWDATRGIIAHVSWTARGEAALRGQEYYSFSPAFEADARSGRVVGLVAGHAAGGLVNAPAFGNAMPALIAARLGGIPSDKPAPGGNPSTNHHTMKDMLIKLLAAFKVTHAADATEDQLIELVAKHVKPVDQSAEVRAVTAKLEDSKKETETLKTAVQAAEKRADELETKIEEVKSVQATLKTSVTSDKVDITDALAAYAAHDPAQLEWRNPGRNELARKRAMIFARDIAPFIKKEGKHGLHTLLCLRNEKQDELLKIVARQAKVAIKAANSLGTLSGSLIAQRSLSLLKAKLPALSLFTTDFSMENSKLNQTVITRVRGIPTAQTYNPVTGYQAAPVTDTDVPVTITDHRYVQFAYNANELGSTNRDLFTEQAEGTLYAIGKDFVDAVLALFTLANYSAGAQHTVVASASWNRVALLAARASLVTRHVYPDKDAGFAIQNPTYYAALATDPSIVSLAVFQDSEIITDGMLPPIAGIKPWEYADFPANGVNLTSIVGTAGCAAIASRLPYDYVDAQIGSNYGAVSQVTDPDTGLSVMLTQYVNHDLGNSNYRVAVMKGQAVGDSTRVQLITSS